MGVQVQWSHEIAISRRTTNSMDSGSLGKLKHRLCQPLPREVTSLRSPSYFSKDVRNMQNAHVFDYGSCFTHNHPTKDESEIKHLIGTKLGDCIYLHYSIEQTSQTKSNKFVNGCNISFWLRWDIFGNTALK